MAETFPGFRFCCTDISFHALLRLNKAIRNMPRKTGSERTNGASEKSLYTDGLTHCFIKLETQQDSKSLRKRINAFCYWHLVEKSAVVQNN